MRIHYNVTGRERKALVNVIAEVTGAQPIYKRLPTYAYEIDYFTVTKDGTLEFSDRSDSEEVEAVLEALAEAGFEGIGETNDDAEEESEDSSQPQDAEEEAAKDDEPTGLTISFPLDGMDDAALERLTRLLNSKAKLICKALNAQRVTFLTTEDTIRFPWWDEAPERDEGMAAAAFIAAIVKMAKESKRVTATEKDVQSEKYAFRSFLLRLGFVGADSKAFRKTLLKNLSGSAAFPNEAAASAFSAAQKAKREAARSSATAPTEADTASEEAMA